MKGAERRERPRKEPKGVRLEVLADASATSVDNRPCDRRHRVERPPEDTPTITRTVRRERKASAADPFWNNRP